MNYQLEMWNKMLFCMSRNYLMAAGSPEGSDRDVSSMGIVFGHAYSILDVYELEGNRLVQLRNPWGDETEWKGAWGDKSKEWNDSRRREAIYSRMKQRGVAKVDIGENDGVFWMSFKDFISNFASLFICKVFE